MLSANQRDMLLKRISVLEREQIILELRQCPARFPIDFTDEWMARQPIEDLRHIFAAICLQCDHLPMASGHGIRPAA